ncbi:hypothetical protein V502_05544, partial [Pseudogymnoascus sp. VKM F-4520 (FW-2644)]
GAPTTGHGFAPARDAGCAGGSVVLSRVAAVGGPATVADCADQPSRAYIGYGMEEVSMMKNNNKLVLLAIQAIKQGHIQSVRGAATSYDINQETLRRRIRGMPSRRDCTPNSRKLTPYEESALGVGTYPTLFLPYKLAGNSRLPEVPPYDTLSADLDSTYPNSRATYSTANIQTNYYDDQT